MEKKLVITTESSIFQRASSVGRVRALVGKQRQSVEVVVRPEEFFQIQ